MEFGLAELSVIPGRAEPADSAEMVTQLLFGELYQILEIQDKWCKVKLLHDAYECWIARNQVHSISESDFLHLAERNAHRVQDNVATARHNSEKREHLLPFGSIIRRIDEWEVHGSFTDGTVNQDLIPELSQQLLDTPYLWGGRTTFGIDCSGFTQVLLSMCGIDLPRDAYQQETAGEPIESLSRTQPGDLAFFAEEGKRISHVGILLSSEQIIHASGKVRIDQIDEIGITNSESGELTHELRSIRRFKPVTELL